MKNLLFVLASIFFTSLVLAAPSDVTFLGSLHPGQTKVKILNLPEGRHSITVFSDSDDAIFTCEFVNENGFLGLHQEQVPNCSGILNSKSPMTVELSITNASKKDFDYQLAVQQLIVIDKKKNKTK